MDNTPILRNSKEHDSDMMSSADGQGKKLADQQVYIDTSTSSIKREILENQPINGQPKNDPFTEVLNSEEFSSAFASPKKWPLNEPQKPNKCMKISAFHSAEDSTEQLIQLAPSKTTQINMATAFLTSKKHQWWPQSLWSAVSELNQVIAHPESGTTFYQIMAKYFEQFREIAPQEVGNVIRFEIAKIFTAKPELDTGKQVRNASKLYIAFLFVF